jgi:hypothetical protein
MYASKIQRYDQSVWLGIPLEETTAGSISSRITGSGERKSNVPIVTRHVPRGDRGELVVV